MKQIDNALDADQQRARHPRRRAEPLRERGVEHPDHRRERWRPPRPHRRRRLRARKPPTCRARRSCSRPAPRWWPRPTSCRSRCCAAALIAAAPPARRQHPGALRGPPCRSGMLATEMARRTRAFRAIRRRRPAEEWRTTQTTRWACDSAAAGVRADSGNPTEHAVMPQTINTNIASLNAQRNLNTSPGLAGHVDAAPVVRPARQQRQGRRRRPGDRRAHEHAGARPERRGAQRQRRHLAGADRRRRAGQGRRHAAAHARTGGAGVQRHQQRRPTATR